MIELADKVSTSIERFEMAGPGDRVLVAVSGGADSVCLLDVLCGLKERMDMTCHVVHVDHTTRNGESAVDAEFVSDLARRYGIPCDVVRVDVDGEREPGESFEVAARRLRYAAFRQVARRCDAARVATGHTADDQAETVLMRVVRGTGPSGLAGIPPVADREGTTVVRPLIGVWRAEIEQYLRERGISWREDVTNAMTTYLRNRVRLELLPELERGFNPAVKAALVRLADLTRDEQSVLVRYARDAAGPAVVSETDQSVSIDRTVYRSLPVALRRLCVMGWSSAALGRTWRCTADTVDRCVRFLSSDATTGQIHLVEGITVRLEYDRAVFCRTSPSGDPRESDAPVVLPVPGRASVEWAGRMFTARTLSRTDAPADIKRACRHDVQYFDADKVEGPVAVRPRRRGDTFRPFGLDGTVKLSDFLINKKVPARLRGSVPLVVCDTGIMWVVGYGADERFAVDEASSQLIEVEVVCREEWGHA